VTTLTPPTPASLAPPVPPPDGRRPEDLAALLRRRPAPPPREGRARRRTVESRLLGSFVLVLLAFALTTLWSFRALRAGARDADLLRSGYVPLLLRIGEALAEQNVLGAQLNHITAAKNPGDVREWIETARRTRPLTFAQMREAAEQGMDRESDPQVRRFREEIAREVASIERALDSDPERFTTLFQALRVGDGDAAERARNDLVKREAEGAQRLRSTRARVEDAMESLTEGARRREQRSVQLLVGLGLLTLLVGALTSLYARRVLAPLTAVTDRAKAVARGDLTPRSVVATPDEIGELATTFEGMVAAIQRARAELVQAERLATIGKMAAHVTHEIRNPLSSIGLNIELLEEELAASAALSESRQLVAAIKSEVERLSRIAEQYLSVARRPRPRLERERVEDLVSELLAFVRPELERAGVASHVEADEGLPEVELDESQLRQALLNLIRNAREAMPKGGALTLAVRRFGPSVELCVEDTGAGIPEDVRASIFDPFFTTKQRGTGLGLAVTREIVEAHGGSIACEPRAPQGTRFRLLLPAA
jgi:two-component system, NtrC family, sensor kinase